MAFGKPRLGLMTAACCAVLSGCTSTELGGMVGGTLAPPDPVGPVQEHPPQDPDLRVDVEGGHGSIVRWCQRHT